MMMRMLTNQILALLLGGSMALCPYWCRSHPRSINGDRAEACGGGCHGGCDKSAQKPTPPQKPDGPHRSPTKPCSCPCVCKGALTKFPGQISSQDLDRSDTAPTVTSTAEAPALVLGVAWPQVPEAPPPKSASGREIRTVIESLLL